MNLKPTSVTKTFKIEELINAISNYPVYGVNSIENKEKISYGLKHSVDYRYDLNKSLAENICAAFPAFHLKAASDDYSRLMNAWKNQDLSTIDTSQNIVLMALSRGIPNILSIR